MQQNDLVVRVERLEQGYRAWRMTAIALVAVLAMTLLVGFKAADFPQPDMIRARSIEAQSFMLRDGNEHVWARMSVGADGARLTFFDEHGNVVSSLPLRAEIRPAR